MPEVDEQATRRSSMLRTAGMALMLGVGGAGLFIGIIDGGRSSIFSDPGAYIGTTVLFSLIAFVVMLVQRRFARGPFGTWPRWKEFERSSDEHGLPVVRWREGSIFLPPRQLRVMRDAEGEWQLLFISPKLVQRRGGMQDWVFGLLGPMASGLSQMAKYGGEPQLRPWATLTTIEVTPWKQVHGGVGLLTHQRRERSDVLLAWFSDGSSIELSDWWWSRGALADLSNMIRSEFIERRTEHLSRAAAAARNAARAAGNERNKVI